MLSILALVQALALTTSVNAAEPGKGLKEPTADQFKAQHKHKIKKVRPTKKAFERANEERRKQGLPELDPNDAADPGSEIEGELNGATVSGTSSGALTASLVPAAVDNTTMPSFPAIANQGNEGSCVAFATTYYQMSHETCLARGCDNKTLKQAVFSPKWTYNMINDGVDGGSYFSDANSLLANNGAIQLSRLPYVAGDYKSWDLNTQDWRDAVRFRMNPVQYISALDTDAGLQNTKQLLANGHVLVIGTYISSWVMGSVKADPAVASNPFAGQPAMLYQNGSVGGHAMTFVGYDDSVWVDINANGVVDAGEKGAFKVVNSWGTGCGAKCGNGTGAIWMPYDAIKTVSAVVGAPTTRVSSLQSKTAYFSSAKASYDPKLLAQFTVNSGLRNQMNASVGASATTASSPSKTAGTGALNYAGGGFGFDGSVNAIDGTFVLDLSDLIPAGSSTQNYYLTVSDSVTGSPVAVNNFSLYDPRVNQVVANSSAALVADASTVKLMIASSYNDGNQSPVAQISKTSTADAVAVNVDFNGSSSYDPDGSIASYSWNFGDGSAVATGAMVSHSYTKAGTFTASLTVTDNNGAASTSSVVINGPSDSVAPNAPSNLAYTLQKQGKRFYVNMSWNAATDNSGQAVTYLIYRSGVLLASTNSLSFRDSGTKAGNTYTYTVQARDPSGNLSVMSNSIDVIR